MYPGLVLFKKKKKYDLHKENYKILMMDIEMA